MRKSNNNRNVLEIFVLVVKARLARNVTARIKSFEVGEGQNKLQTIGFSRVENIEIFTRAVHS